MLQNNPVLKSLINSLWNTLWSGGIANPITAIEQITYLLFIKQLDRMESVNEELLVKKSGNDRSIKLRFKGTYKPYVDLEAFKTDSKKFSLERKKQLNRELKEAQKPRSKSELRWPYILSLAPDQNLVIHIKYNVFPFVKELNGSSSLFTRHMVNAVFILEKPTLLYDAIRKIDEIYREIESDAKDGGHNIQDIQGDVYEMLLSEIAQAGKNGQFRTPRHIIKLMTSLIDPQLGQKISDPACGTGGFLVGAYQHILTNLVRETDANKVEKDDDGFDVAAYSEILGTKNKNLLSNSFFGFDIDVTMVRLGLMNLMMHGIDNPKIDLTDTLSQSFNEKNKYDIILANPPFTGKIDINDVNANFRIQTTSTELLFLDRISTMLAIGGRAAVIVPEGVLFGTSKAQKSTREIILKDNELISVISLPSGAFKPYTGVKTAILVFKKIEQNSTQWNTTKVWFYELKSDGYSLDDNRRRLKDFPLVDANNSFINRNKKRNKQRKEHFFITLDEIQKNDLDLSFNRYRTYEYLEETYPPPKEILDSILSLESEIFKGIEELSNLIG